MITPRLLDNEKSFVDARKKRLFIELRIGLTKFGEIVLNDLGFLTGQTPLNGGIDSNFTVFPKQSPYVPANDQR